MTVKQVEFTKDPIAGSIDGFIRNKDELLRIIPIVSEIRFVYFCELVKAGFSESQALEVCRGKFLEV